MNFERKIYLTKLYDIYYELYTKKQQVIFEMYIDEDLSNTEIAEKLNVSKANITQTLKQVEKKLINYEENLKIYNNYIENIKLLKNNNISEEIIKKIK